MSESIFIEVANLVLSLVAIAMAYGVFSFFNKTTFALPLRVLGLAFLVFLIHEAVGTYAEFVEKSGALEIAYHWLEIIFALTVLFGLYLFKVQFEKFEWVKQINSGSEIIGKD